MRDEPNVVANQELGLCLVDSHIIQGRKVARG